MAIKFYKGFEIVVAPLQDTETESWVVDVVVRERTEGGLINRHYLSPEETFPSEIDAVKAGFLCGEGIVEEQYDPTPRGKSSDDDS